MAVQSKALLLLSAFICVHLWFTSSASAAENGIVWWEGEDAVRTNVPARSPFGPGTGGNFDVLSGGDWISGQVRPGGRPYEAQYLIEAPADGTYTLWARKFWKHGPFEWRFDDQKWTQVGREVTLADSATIRTHLVANWVAVGDVKLTAGRHAFWWRMTDLQPGKDEAVGFDCFALVPSDAAFTPRGKLKPNQRDTRADDGWFAWDPPRDEFPEDAGFDHRDLNEEFAGIHGRVRKTDDGNGLLLGDGTPVRFWGVNVKPDFGDAPDGLLNHWARRMAKIGVNLVRIHGPLWTKQHDQWRVDPRKLENVHRLVAALKQQGIYTEISWYFPIWIDARHAGLPGYHDANIEHPFASHMFNDRVQRWYLDTLRDIVTPVNPHTGLSLADDPAVAMIELVNEDSFFFWTFNPDNMPEPIWDELQDMYEDSPHYAGGELRGVWNLTREGQKNAGRRELRQLKAQAAFLANLQRGFYEKAIAALRGHGYDGLTVCSNWHTADPPMLDALERWTYTAGDVIDHHGYFESKHTGSAAAWAVRAGDTFESRSALQNLDALPLRVNQVRGHPQMISEVNWPLPNEHRADMVWLGVAALGAQGVDAVCWFQCTSLTGVETNWVQKFTIDVPSITGQFPAAALAFRRGDVPEQEPVVVESIKSKDLKALSGSATANHASIEAFRAGDAQQIEDFDGVDPLAYYVGPVVRVFDDPSIKSWQRSAGGVLAGDDVHVPGVLQTSHPTSLALHGQSRLSVRLGPAPIRDFDLLPSSHEIAPSNDDGAVSMISLDGKPLRRSNRVLFQAIRTEKPYGFVVTDGQIKSMGGAPLNVTTPKAGFAILFEDDRPARATVLDENGDRTTRPVPLIEKNGSVGFDWPANTVSVLLERDAEPIGNKE